MTFTSYSQNYEDVLLWRALKDEAPGFYIDVGAWEPDLHSVTRAFSERGWRGINIEPTPECFARLAASRPQDINLQVALGAHDGEAVLYDIVDTGLSTTVADIASDHAAAGYEIRTLATPVTTLAQVCRDHAESPIHFLKIDCEGAERDVLLGADLVAFRPWIILIEATAPNSPRPVHAQWDDLVLAADYRFVWFDGLNRFYVAQEQHDRLAPLIALPPNVFDDFVIGPPGSLPAEQLAPEEEAIAPLAVDPFVARHDVMLSTPQRVQLAQRCHDCDSIPKVAGAGEVHVDADGTRIQIMHNGVKVLADGYQGEWMTMLIHLCRGHHEPQEELVFDALARLLPEDATMIELGGNWAYYSAWFAHNRPDRRVMILEPDPAYQAVGERNFALNGLDGHFVSGFAAKTPRAVEPFATETSGTLPLRGYSVPELMTLAQFDTLDMLHCDTQGAELDILEGCRPLFAAGRIGWVVVSTHTHQISGDPLTHQRCLALLEEIGAVVEVEHDPYESFSGDGLIVARLRDAPAGWSPIVVSRARRTEALFRDPLYDLAESLPLAELGRGRVDEIIASTYQAFLNRGASDEEIAAHRNVLMQHGSFAALFRSFMASPEYRQLARTRL